MLPSLLGRVQQLFEFIHSQPLPQQLVAYLSENFCPMGEAAAVAVSRLHEDGRVICELADGFKFNDRLVGSTSSILSDRPGSETLMKLKMLILTDIDIENKYQDFIKQDFMEGFKSAILIPIGNRKIYGLALQIRAKEIDGFEEYAECVQSLITFYESFVSSSRESKSMDRPISASKELTKRQELIVQLIKRGKTNQIIALELGYSESLIRQETIIIYRKLGISGRKDLISEKV